MIWDNYLKTVKNNDPWEIAFRWAKFASLAVQNMDSKVARTQEYIRLSNDLLRFTESRNAERVDSIAKSMAPIDDMHDESFFVDQYYMNMICWHLFRIIWQLQVFSHVLPYCLHGISWNTKIRCGRTTKKCRHSLKLLMK